MKKIILALSLLFVTSNLFALTLSDIRNEVRRKLGDMNISYALEKYDDTQLNLIINEGHRNIMTETYCVVRSTVIPLAANTTSYTLPSDFFVEKRVIYNNQKLEEKTVEGLDREESASWVVFSTASVPECYYISFDRKEVGIYPIVSHAQAQKRFELWYIAIPTLTNDTDVPFDGVYKLYPYHNLLIFYTMSQLLANESKNNATYYYNLYVRGLTNMNNFINVTPDHIPSLKFDSGRPY